MIEALGDLLQLLVSHLDTERTSTLAGILAAFSELEREMLRERVRADISNTEGPHANHRRASVKKVDTKMAPLLTTWYILPSHSAYLPRMSRP
jgi:hypothetical protein